jgi:hypothetical protein
MAVAKVAKTSWPSKPSRSRTRVRSAGSKPPHGRPALVDEQAVLGRRRLGRVGAAGPGFDDGVVQHSLERIHAPSAQPAPLGRVDEVIEEVGQLHHVAIGIEDHPLTGVGHRLPLDLVPPHRVC